MTRIEAVAALVQDIVENHIAADDVHIAHSGLRLLEAVGVLLSSKDCAACTGCEIEVGKQEANR